MTRKNLNYLLIIALIVFAGLFVNATRNNHSYYVSVNGKKDAHKGQQYGDTGIEKTSRAVKIPNAVEFAGERLPLEDIEVKERLDRELIVTTYYHSSTILFLKRANRWFPVIEPILAEQGVPDDFKYIAQSESSLTNAVSPMRAVGFWQFRELAAKEQGLEVSGEVDERYHVEKSTVAACKYLKQLKEQFGSWTLAMAAYNYGPSKVKSQIERQGQNVYWDLLLPSETSRYVFRVIAFKLAYENPEQYGFVLEESDLYPPLDFKVLVIDEEVESWKDFCAQNNITYKTLKWYNPWLRENHLKNPKGKEYKIKMPV